MQETTLEASGHEELQELIALGGNFSTALTDNNGAPTLEHLVSQRNELEQFRPHVYYRSQVSTLSHFDSATSTNLRAPNLLSFQLTKTKWPKQHHDDSQRRLWIPKKCETKKDSTETAYRRPTAVNRH